MWSQLLARIYGVFALQCSRCGGRVRLLGFITEPAMVREIRACRRANKCTGNRTDARATVDAEWTAAGCSGEGGLRQFLN